MNNQVQTKVINTILSKERDRRYCTTILNALDIPLEIIICHKEDFSKYFEMLNMEINSSNLLKDLSLTERTTMKKFIFKTFSDDLCTDNLTKLNKLLNLKFSLNYLKIFSEYYNTIDNIIEIISTKLSTSTKLSICELSKKGYNIDKLLKLPESRFTPELLYLIEKFPKDKDLSILLDDKFNIKQLTEIVIGVNEGVDYTIYAKTDFNHKQMKQIRKALSVGCSKELIDKLTPNMSHDSMKILISSYINVMVKELK